VKSLDRKHPILVQQAENPQPGVRTIHQTAMVDGLTVRLAEQMPEHCNLSRLPRAFGVSIASGIRKIRGLMLPTSHSGRGPKSWERSVIM